VNPNFTKIADLYPNIAPQYDDISDKFTIPLQLNQPMVKHFAGRKPYLDRLHEMMTENAAEKRENLTNIIVIHATGGMGKTQLVLRYIHQHLKLFSAVFWVNGSSLETVQASFIGIAERLVKYYGKMQKGSPPDYFSIARDLDMIGLVDEKGCIVAGDNSASLAVKAVKAWLSLAGNNKWLIVFDNVDDLESFDISESFPYKASIGSVIITTRRPECLEFGDGFELKEMEESEGIETLSKCSNIPIEPGSEGERLIRSPSCVHARPFSHRFH
jgi:hypothetical protein